MIDLSHEQFWCVLMRHGNATSWYEKVLPQIQHAYGVLGAPKPPLEPYEEGVAEGKIGAG